MVRSLVLATATLLVSTAMAKAETLFVGDLELCNWSQEARQNSFHPSFSGATFSNAALKCVMDREIAADTPVGEYVANTSNCEAAGVKWFSFFQYVNISKTELVVLFDDAEDKRIQRKLQKCPQ